MLCVYRYLLFISKLQYILKTTYTCITICEVSDLWPKGGKHPATVCWGWELPNTVEHLVLSINKRSRCVYTQTTKGASCPASLHVISRPPSYSCSPCPLVLSCSVVLAAPGGGSRQARLLQPSAPYSPTFSGPSWRIIPRRDRIHQVRHRTHSNNAPLGVSPTLSG